MEKEGESIQTLKAINYIKDKVELSQKENFILEFGQILMKNDPENCLELIKRTVMLSSLGAEYNKKSTGKE